MTRVLVDAGICGYSTEVEVIKISAQRVSVALTSDCEMVNQVVEQVRELDWRDALRERENSLLCKSVFRCIRHAACPVPVAIIKAIEVEVAMALPKDVFIHFLRPPGVADSP